MFLFKIKSLQIIGKCLQFRDARTQKQDRAQVKGARIRKNATKWVPAVGNAQTHAGASTMDTLAERDAQETPQLLQTVANILKSNDFEASVVMTGRAS